MEDSSDISLTRLTEAITEPLPQDRQILVDTLSRGYYVRSRDTHEPSAAYSYLHSDGLVSLLFSDLSKAEGIAKQIEEAYEEPAEVCRVTGLWDLFRECAACGYQGVVLDNYYPVTLFNRLTDIDRSLPSLMYMRFPDSSNDLYGFFSVEQA